VITGSIVTIRNKPWKLGLGYVRSYLDRNLDSLEYSSGLLLRPQEELTGLALLQQERTSLQLDEGIKRVKPDDGLLKAIFISAGLVLLGFIIHISGITENFHPTPGLPGENEIIVFKPADSIPPQISQPILESQQVVISYPAYTGIGAVTTSNMNIKVLEGSRATWKLGFDSKVNSVIMESSGGSYPMKLSGDSYTRSTTLQNPGFYNFRFRDSIGAPYVSDLFSIEISKDQSPVIEVEGLSPFISFDHDENKALSFSVNISDDFGIGEAVIIATVSKGTGESVKFREEQLNFDNPYNRGSKNIQLRKQINLDNLNMEPGDELYFYIRATDLKTPQPNISRSETYFAVVRDTASTGFGMESTLGVDLMPDYFRSQRQLIIDTEKLISQRPSLPKTDFNATSNDLGFDQKSLRLRYGQFMGDETEGAISENGQMPERDDDEDPLAEFTHDHDGDNEHNLVAHDPVEEEEDEAHDPLSEFLHDHGDPESATLFTDNLRSKIRQALDIMWDAELHLRLYEPEKSLPFQYRALALLQEIKNSARIYVHRIGYDPPPIRDDVRLTGKIDEVGGFQKNEDLEKEDPYLNMRRAVSRLEQLAAGNQNITAGDRRLFGLAANELAILAIDSPGNFLNTLQELKWLTEERPASRRKLLEVQKGLFDALPVTETKPGKAKIPSGELNNLLLQELERNEQ
ncbi:MAG TPA: hypothetical protein VLN46_04570, partial [Gillisia sp.]|nr:hypothetical protein [Gillisia sp.]